MDRDRVIYRRTKNCVYCFARATQWQGHVVNRDGNGTHEEVIAGWCAIHGRHARRAREFDNRASDHKPAEGFVGHYRAEMGFEQ